MLTSEHTVLLQLDGLGVDELRDLGAGSARVAVSAGRRPTTCAHRRQSVARPGVAEQVSSAAFDDSEVPLPAPRSFATLVVARLTACEPDVERLVAAASVVGMHTALDLAAVVAGVDDPLAALERAIAAGLLEERLGERGASFPHPLVHAAVYRQIGPARRAALHLKAADHADDEALRLRHRARAATGPDARAVRRPGSAGTPEAISRGPGGARPATFPRRPGSARTVPTDERYHLGGRGVPTARRRRRRPAALPLGCGRLPRPAGASYVLAKLVMLAGPTGDCEALLRDAWQRCDPDVDPVLGARIAGQFAGLYGFQMRPAEQTEWADLALRLAPDADRDRHDSLHCGSTVRAMSGQAATTLPSLAGLPDPAVASAAELEELLGRGTLRLFADDLDGALRDIGGVFAASHDRSATFRWVAAVELAVVEFRAGRWDDALVHAELGVSIAADADQEHLDWTGHKVAALVRAARGEWSAAEVHARVLQTAAISGHPNRVFSSALVQAQLGQGTGTTQGGCSVPSNRC